MKIELTHMDGRVECIELCPCETDTPEIDLCINCRIALEEEDERIDEEYSYRLRNGDIETELE